MKANEIPAVLVANHGPFTFGKDAEDSVFHSVVLEEVSFMNWHLEV
ncbi:MAG: class II aldolase/adducin family protein, partial [Anaerococcus hydrogenalis]|nr:class II aldolase/adducin family protein [Anaerococcus hydrogenalis]